VISPSGQRSAAITLKPITTQPAPTARIMPPSRRRRIMRGVYRTPGSLGRARLWALAGHATMPPHAATRVRPPETRERRCPACQSERIALAGHIKAAGGLIKSEQRCEACGTASVFVSKAVL